MQEASNNPALQFSDLTSEEWREYHFPTGAIVRIEQPVALNVSKSGGHRVQTTAGVSEYIPAGWIRLRWQNKSGLPAFQF